MEKLVNCHIITEIECIENVSGANQFFEIIFYTRDKKKYKLVFDFVWDLRCSTENGYIDRASKFIHAEEEKSSILLVENSDYVKYFETQVSGTRPIEDVKDYIIYDAIDTIIEILTISFPKLLEV